MPVGFFASRSACRRSETASQKRIYLGTAFRIDIAHLGAVELRSGDITASRSFFVGDGLSDLLGIMAAPFRNKLIECRAFIALQLRLIAHLKTGPEKLLLGSDYVAI